MPDEQLLCEKQLSPELLEAIGKVMVEWAYIEHMMEIAIWKLSNLNERKGMCFTAKINNLTKFNILRSLGCELFGENSAEHKELLKISQDFKDASELRNGIAHAKWQKSETNGEALQIRIKVGKKLDHDSPSVSPESLRQIAVNFEEIGHDLMYFLQKNGLEP